MPFSSVSEATSKHPSLKKYSKNAQQAFVSAFNNAYKDHDESSAFAIAWSAAKKADKK